MLKNLIKQLFVGARIIAGLYLILVATACIGPRVSQANEFIGHTDLVNSISFSPDNRYILSGSDDKTIRLWDIKSGREIRRFDGHSNGVYVAVFSPDGRHCISGGKDSIIRLWEIETGREIRRFEGHRAWVESLAFSPDGRYVLSGSYQPWIDEVRKAGETIPLPRDNSIRLWDVNNGSEIRRFGEHKDGIESVAFSPDGRYAVSGSWDHIISLWNVETGQEIRRLNGHNGNIVSANFSADGRYILSSGLDNTVRLWDAQSGEEIRQLDIDTFDVLSVGFTPDGRRILTCSNDVLSAWERESGREIYKFTPFKGIKSRLHAMVFSPKGNQALSSTYDNMIRLWDLPD